MVQDSGVVIESAKAICDSYRVGLDERCRGTRFIVLKFQASGDLEEVRLALIGMQPRPTKRDRGHWPSVCDEFSGFVLECRMGI